MSSADCERIAPIASSQLRISCAPLTSYKSSWEPQRTAMSSDPKKARLYFASGRVKVAKVGAVAPVVYAYPSYSGRHMFQRTGDTYNGARIYREVE